MARHPELTSLIAEQIEAVRIKETSRPILEKWFADVKSIIDEFNIQPQDIYNMDETGFSIGSIKATRVIIDRTQNIRYSAYPGRQEWVSAIECISMDGTALPPLVIFKGKTLSTRWISPNTPTDWFFSCNQAGWTSNEHTKRWIKEDFEPITRDKASGRTRLLIFDEHGSHTTVDVVRHCILNHIQLALLPPHSSHLTQPLDIGVFSSMKTHMTQQLDRYIRTGIPRLQKIEWLEAFIKARASAFTTQNIMSGWSGTGLHPFNPHKVLHRLPILPSLESSPQSPTPIFETPLDNPELTSSPIESAAMTTANAHIKNRARNSTASVDTPRARRHVIRMATALNRSLAKNRVQATQLSELQHIVSARKERQSGTKHSILHGQTIIAAPKVLLQLQKAEEATLSRNSKRQKLTHTSPLPPTIDPSLCLDPLDADSDEDSSDCIVVMSR